MILFCGWIEKIVKDRQKDGSPFANSRIQLEWYYESFFIAVVKLNSS